MNQPHQETYSEMVNQEFVKLFFQTKITDPEFHSALLSSIVRCFHYSANGLTDQQKSQTILESLFYIFSSTISPAAFSLHAFIEKHIQDRDEIDFFLTALLYGLYYRDIYLVAHQIQNQRKNLELLMYQIVAENASPQTLRKILSHLTLDMRITLVCYAFKHYREGSYYILKELERFACNDACSKTDQLLIKLIAGLRTRYFNVHKFYFLLLEISNVDEASLAKLVEHLEEYSIEQTRIIYHKFTELIPLIVNYPLLAFSKMEKENPLGAADSSIVQDKKNAEMQKERLKALFHSFLSRNYSFEEFLDFTELFGIVEDTTVLKFQNRQCSDRSLAAKTLFLHEAFSNAHTLTLASKEEIQTAINFALKIVKHLESLHDDPSLYKKGLDALTFGMPTGGKLLEKLPSLPSVLQGFLHFFKHLNSKLSEPISLSHFPFFVYDQSEPEVFEKNQSFIEKLNKEHGCSIVQLSSEEILKLAAKIGVGPLIGQDTSRNFGFGGMRNCVFLLTPMLKNLFSKGKKTYDEIISMEDSELKAVFHQSIQIAPTIFMVDDDMEIPASNIYSYALYAQESKGRYSSLHGYILGRNSRSFIFQDPGSLLKLPEYSPHFIQWLDTLLDSSLAIFVGKPKICLNIPFGWEEDHSLILSDPASFLHTVRHLSGPRFPKGKIPTHFFVGLEQRLSTFVPYCLTSLLSNCLLDPENQLQHLALPWNDPKQWLAFSSLQDMLACIAGEDTKIEMQKKFWKNVNGLFLSPQGRKMEIFSLTSELMHCPVDSIINEFLKKESLTELERNSLNQIGQCYLFFQEDARYFWEYGTSVMENILKRLKQIQNDGMKNPVPWYEACVDRQVNLISIINSVKGYMEDKYQIKLSTYPITDALYSLFYNIGAAKFNEAVALSLKK